jgi:hypothetical protein
MSDTPKHPPTNVVLKPTLHLHVEDGRATITRFDTGASVVSIDPPLHYDEKHNGSAYEAVMDDAVEPLMVDLSTLLEGKGIEWTSEQLLREKAERPSDLVRAKFLRLVNRKLAGGDCDQDESAWIKGFFDVYPPNSPYGQIMATRYPLELDEWTSERARGERPDVSNAPLAERILAERIPPDPAPPAEVRGWYVPFTVELLTHSHELRSALAEIRWLARGEGEWPYKHDDSRLFGNIAGAHRVFRDHLGPDGYEFTIVGAWLVDAPTREEAIAQTHVSNTNPEGYWGDLFVSKLDVGVPFAVAARAPAAAPVAATAPTMWTHEFHVPLESIPRFVYRPTQEWLRDVLDSAGFAGQYTEATVFEGSVGDGHHRAWIVTVAGTEAVLRFCCVLFNQHAEQSPDDTTPVGEAARLEETLAKPPIPPCPNCGARNWSADCDIRNRAKVSFGGLFERVYVDRVGPEGSTIAGESCVTCDTCGYTVETTDADLYEPLMEAAGAVVAAFPDDRRWTVIYDYREV